MNRSVYVREIAAALEQPPATVERAAITGTNASGLSLSLAYDYSDTYKAQATWTATTIDALSTNIGRIQLAHQGHDEDDGVAVRVLLTDATPTGASVGTGKGSTWIGLTFEGTPRDGATQLPEETR